MKTLPVRVLLTFIPIVAGSLVAATITSPTQPKAAWQWSNADRIKVRFDQAKVRERVANAEATRPLSSQALPHATQSVTRRYADVIDGRSHPELFFPHELFEPMMKFAFVLDDPDYRARLAKHAPEVGLPPDFWDRLRDLSAAYISDLRQQHERVTRLQGASRDQIRKLQATENASAAIRCGDRAAALQAARKEFGPAFLRLLYTYIAPGQSITYAAGDDPTTPADNPERLIAAEEGCK